MELRNYTLDSLVKELDRRYPERVKIKTPEDTIPTIRKKIGKKKVENYGILTLDGAHQILKWHTITTGTVNRCLVHPREIFRPAITDNAVAVILCHNHPSEEVTPSAEDRDIHKRMTDAGKIIGIAVLDSIIIGGDTYHSMLENG